MNQLSGRLKFILAAGTAWGLCYGCFSQTVAKKESHDTAKPAPLIVCGLGMIEVDTNRKADDVYINRKLAEFKNRGFTVIWDASPPDWLSGILEDPAEIAFQNRFAQRIRDHGMGNAFTMKWGCILPVDGKAGLKQEWLGMTLDPVTGLPVYGAERCWNYGSPAALDAFRGRFASFISKLTQREMFVVQEVTLGAPGEDAHFKTISGYWTSPTYTVQALAGFRNYLKGKGYPDAATAKFPVTTKKLAPCGAANLGLPAIPLNEKNSSLLQADNDWPQSPLWQHWYSWREDILVAWIDACSAEAVRAWGGSPDWLGVVIGAPDFWFVPALALNADKIAALPQVDCISTGYMSGNRFAKLKDIALRHGKQWGTVVQTCNYGQEKGIDPGDIVMSFKYQVNSGSPFIFFYALANFNTDLKADDPRYGKNGLHYMPEQCKAWDECIQWAASKNGIRKLDFKKAPGK